MKNGQTEREINDSPPGPPETVGGSLRARRMRRGVDLEEVSAATGISVSVLEALENEDREQLPAEVYVKAFYKKYAEYLGVDPEDIGEKYQHQPKDLKKRKHSAGFNTVVTLKGQEEKMAVEILRRLILPVALLILGLVFYWIYKNYLGSYNAFGFDLGSLHLFSLLAGPGSWNLFS